MNLTDTAHWASTAHVGSFVLVLAVVATAAALLRGGKHSVSAVVFVGALALSGLFTVAHHGMLGLASAPWGPVALGGFVGLSYAAWALRGFDRRRRPVAWAIVAAALLTGTAMAGSLAT